jgi:cysteine-rich repeat protein
MLHGRTQAGTTLAHPILPEGGSERRNSEAGRDVMKQFRDGIEAQLEAPFAARTSKQPFAVQRELVDGEVGFVDQVIEREDREREISDDLPSFAAQPAARIAEQRCECRNTAGTDPGRVRGRPSAEVTDELCVNGQAFHDPWFVGRTGELTAVVKGCMRWPTIACLSTLMLLSACAKEPDDTFTTGLTEVGNESTEEEESSTNESGTETETETESETETETETGEDPYCGDGTVDANEECDNGPSNADDAECTSMCLNAVCGDGLVQIGVEACDDGNPIDNDMCSTDCELASCGDGLVQPPEQCDDGNVDDSDFCTSLCQMQICGDGFVYDGFEDCDDGNMDDTDACTGECEGAFCGDGFLWADMEMCDDGNNDNDDDCVGDCVAPTCGDGFVWMGMEQCDDGNNVSDDGCTADCMAECDGFVIYNNWNGWKYYKVPVMGTMTDPNIYAACMACGLQTPCASTQGCQYNNNMCTQTNNEVSCGSPMFGLSQQLGCGSPPNCMALNGVYQYMGGNWVGGCGVEGALWCAQGNSNMNKFALCVGPA